jgi:hypothetical protein
MARIDRRRERMRALVERWRRSGETAAAFCRRQRIHPQKLSYWKRVLGLTGPVVKRRRVSGRAPGFVPVRLLGGGVATGHLEILLAGGDRVVLHEGVSRELMRDALIALRERC